MELLVSVLLPALVACVAMTLLLGYLGVHVLAREVIFVDIALAQIASLGAAVAALVGLELHTAAAYVSSLVFAMLGAALFAATRTITGRVPQEAFIGIVYAVAAAATVLVAGLLPHGDEELEELLVGSLLTLSFGDAAIMVGVFALLGAFHFALRRRFLTITLAPDLAAQEGWSVRLWDFSFYASLAVMVTTSVHVAGVLLVFAFLVVPSVFAALFARRLRSRLLLAWSMGVVASALGLYASFVLDAPTGASVVVALSAVLLLGVLVAAALPAPRGVSDERAKGGVGETTS